MSDDQQTEALGLIGFDQAVFDVVMRGYDRKQVDEHVSRIELDLRDAGIDRESALQRSADLAAQLASAYAEIESLRVKLRASSSSVTTDNVSERIRSMLELAEQEAARVREEARQYAEQLTNQTNEELAADREEFDAQVTEWQETIGAESTRARAEADEYRTQVIDQMQRQSAAAAAERDRLDAEAARRRETAEDDFTLTLRARRSAELQADELRRTQAREEAERIVTEAQQTAAETVRAALERKAQLDAEQRATTQRLAQIRDEVSAILNRADS